MSSDYCQSIVRTHDPDRFLISMFYPPDIRAHLWALYAFNYEIAKTREVVTNTTLGLIRLQWWRDALAGLYERNIVLKHDVVEGLAQAIWRYNLPRELFDHLIYAREFDLEDQTPGSLEGLCNYADYTHTPLLRLAAMIAGEDADQPALQPVAMAYALTGIVRAIPFHQAQGWTLVPDGVTPGKICDKAVDLLRQAPLRESSGMIRMNARITDGFLNKIKSLKYNTSDIRLSTASAFRPIMLWIESKK